MILAATGLERERSIVAGPEVEAIAGGGDHQRLQSLLETRAATARGIISIGIAGGLAPTLKPGDWVLAEVVMVDGRPMPTDQAWTTRLAARLPHAARGVLLGSDTVVAETAEKTRLHRTSGALAVDMESHIAARVARRRELPFAAARVVCDPAHHALPPAARVGMTTDGRVDFAAVLRSLAARPGQLAALIVTGLEAERAFRSLLRGHRRLGAGLCGPDLGELPLDMS